jgi:PGF-pre-PGF domain-containing protein
MKAFILLVGLLLLASAYADTTNGTVIISGTPNITINSPTANNWYNANFTINASISGAPIAATYRWENSSANGSYASLTYQGSQIWTKAFGITSVADGNYTFRINSTDAASHTDNDTVFIYIDDTEPVISSFSLTKTGTIYTGSTLTSSDFSCSATDNSESFGGSVGIVITGLSTATDGAKTATCTATDSANNTATATVSYIVIFGGGGGAAGGGISGNQSTETAILEQVPAEQTVTLTNFQGPVSGIEIDTALAIRNSDLRLSVLSSGQPIPNAQAFTYFEITSGIPEDAMRSARIIFKVDKSWLEQNGFSPDDVVLYRFNSGVWTNLQTERTGETASDYTYRATTPGFSTFAIAATKQIPSAPEPAITGAAPAVPLEAFGGNAGLIVLIIIIAMFAIMLYRGRKKGRKR